MATTTTITMVVAITMAVEVTIIKRQISLAIAGLFLP